MAPVLKAKMSLIPMSLSCRQNGAEDIKRHKWFKPIDWDAVYNKKLHVGGSTCTHTFDIYMYMYVLEIR